MKKIFLLIALSLALVGCGDSKKTPPADPGTLPPVDSGTPPPAADELSAGFKAFYKALETDNKTITFNVTTGIISATTMNAVANVTTQVVAPATIKVGIKDGKLSLFGLSATVDDKVLTIADNNGAAPGVGAQVVGGVPITSNFTNAAGGTVVAAPTVTLDKKKGELTLVFPDLGIGTTLAAGGVAAGTNADNAAQRAKRTFVFTIDDKFAGNSTSFSLTVKSEGPAAAPVTRVDALAGTLSFPAA